MNHMLKEGMEGVDFVVANTDAQVSHRSEDRSVALIVLEAMSGAIVFLTLC